MFHIALKVLSQGAVMCALQLWINRFTLNVSGTTFYCSPVVVVSDSLYFTVVIKSMVTDNACIKNMNSSVHKCLRTPLNVSVQIKFRTLKFTFENNAGHLRSVT